MYTPRSSLTIYQTTEELKWLTIEFRNLPGTVASANLRVASISFGLLDEELKRRGLSGFWSAPGPVVHTGCAPLTGAAFNLTFRAYPLTHDLDRLEGPEEAQPRQPLSSVDVCTGSYPYTFNPNICQGLRWLTQISESILVVDRVRH